MWLAWVGGGVSAVVVLVAGAAFAGGGPPADCSKAITQTDMNICAAKDYKAADAELNAQYKAARSAMADVDAELDEDLKGAEKALVKAQRAWIDYRDGQCAAEGFQARGGSMEPMLVSGCMATLTRQRSRELKQLADGPGN